MSNNSRLSNSNSVDYLQVNTVDISGELLVGSASIRTATVSQSLLVSSSLSAGSTLVQATQFKVGATGSEIVGIVRGSSAIGSTAAVNGQTVTVTHNMGVIPVFMSGIVSKNGFGVSGDSFVVTVRSFTTTQAIFQIRRVDVDAGWSDTYALLWMVMA